MTGHCSAVELANQTYMLAKGVLGQGDFATLMRSIWRCGDVHPDVNQTLLAEEVAGNLNALLSNQRQRFLDKMWPLGRLGELACWEYAVLPEILEHSMQDQTPRPDQLFKVLFGQVDPGYRLWQLFGLGGSPLRAQMQVMALRNLVYGASEVPVAKQQFLKNCQASSSQIGEIWGLKTH